ncbi:MAG: hypothetical protein IIB09_07115, partial [Bacteroidetes bacterium]|nr:hypothetical protein [Bacteroidota bacterium]
NLGGQPEPLYVTAIDPVKNEITAGPKDALFREEFTVSDVNWTGNHCEPIEADVQIRYRHEAVASCITPLPGGRARVQLGMPQPAVAPGQSAVFYQDDFAGSVSLKEELKLAVQASLDETPLDNPVYRVVNAILIEEQVREGGRDVDQHILTRLDSIDSELRRHRHVSVPAWIRKSTPVTRRGIPVNTSHLHLKVADGYDLEAIRRTLDRHLEIYQIGSSAIFSGGLHIEIDGDVGKGDPIVTELSLVDGIDEIEISDLPF